MRSVVGSLAVAVLFAGCGKPHLSGDAGSSGDGGPDGNATIDASMDASTDAAVDAPSGVLSPEPADPVSSACAGIPGFPGLPGVGLSTGHELLVEDIDLDGVRDVVVGVDNPFVARGKGDGTFYPPVAFSLPYNGWSLRLADLSGDGKPDLVLHRPSPSSPTTSIDIMQATNDGSGGFGTPQTLLTLTNVSMDQMELVDLNGDNKRDLIGFSISGDVTVFLNGASSFGAPTSYAAIGFSTSGQAQMAIGDLSGDGKPDIVVVNGSTTLAVLVNSGTGTFGAPVTYTTPPSAGALTIIDADEDGKLDVVVGSAPQFYKAEIAFLRNKGGGVLDTATTFPVSDGYPPWFVRSADVNGDGHADIAVAQQTGPHVRILLGTGTGQFGAPIVLPGLEIRAFALADLQPDGRADAILVNGTLVTPLLSHGGSQPFETRTSIPFGGTPFAMVDVQIADLNGDNRLDLLAARFDQSTSPSPRFVSTRLGAGAGYGPTSTYPAGPIFRSKLADLNNDSRPDLVTMGYTSSSSLQAFLNNGDGTMSPRAAAGVGASPVDFAIADMDSNGLRDAVVGYGGMSVASQVRTYPGFGNGQFGAGGVIWSGQGFYAVAATDLNEDGNNDVIVWDEQNGLEVLLGTGNGAFAAPNITPMVATFRLFTKDVNKDGHVDVVAFTGSGLAVMLGTGTGTLGAPSMTPGVVTRGDAAFADVDGDGNLDVVAAASGTVWLFRGHGDGTFESPLGYDTGGQNDVSIGDVDGDGHLDIVNCGNPADDSATILYGRCL